MKCPRCGEDKSIWTDFEFIKLPDSTPNSPKNKLLCKECYKKGAKP
jgi:hypothetical protein